MKLKNEEVVLLKRGKPYLGKNITKIPEIIKIEKTDLLFILSDFLKMAQSTEYSNVDVSYFFSDVFHNMTNEMFIFVSDEKSHAPLLRLRRKVDDFEVILEKYEEHEGFVVTCPALRGCITQGDNEKQALENAKEAIEGYLECARKHGITVKQ
jgi:predicted RNase H-like HicB family nuclease